MGGGASRRSDSVVMLDSVLTRTTDLTADEIFLLKHSDLKRRLKSIGLSTDGTHADMAARLAGDISQVERAIEGDGSSYWASVHKFSELHAHRVETVNPAQGRMVGQLRTVQNSLAEARQLCHAAHLSDAQQKAAGKVARVKSLAKHPESADLRVEDVAGGEEGDRPVGSAIVPHEQQAEYRVLVPTPVREAQRHAAEEIHTLRVGQLVKAEERAMTAAGHEWIKLAGWCTAGLNRWGGWAAVLADNGWQVQLGLDMFPEKRKKQREWKKAGLSVSLGSKLARLNEETAEENRRKEAERIAHAKGQLAAHEAAMLEAASQGFCLILDPEGELLGRRPFEVGEWYVKKGMADATEWGNTFLLHEMPEGGAKGVPLEVPYEEEEAPGISMADWYLNRTGGHVFKWEQTASATRQAAAQQAGFSTTSQVFGELEQKGCAAHRPAAPTALPVTSPRSPLLRSQPPAAAGGGRRR